MLRQRIEDYAERWKKNRRGGSGRSRGRRKTKKRKTGFAEMLPFYFRKGSVCLERKTERCSGARGGSRTGDREPHPRPSSTLLASDVAILESLFSGISAKRVAASLTATIYPLRRRLQRRRRDDEFVAKTYFANDIDSVASNSTVSWW